MYKTNKLLKAAFSMIIAILSFNSVFAQFSAIVEGAPDVSPLNVNMTYTYRISNNSVDGFTLQVNVKSPSILPITMFGEDHERHGAFNSI